MTMYTYAIERPSEKKRWRAALILLGFGISFVAMPARVRAVPLTTLVAANASGAPGAMDVTVQVTTTMAINIGNADVGMMFNPGVLQVSNVTSPLSPGFFDFHTGTGFVNPGFVNGS